MACTSRYFMSASGKPLLPQERAQNPLQFSSLLPVHKKQQPNSFITIRQHWEKWKMPSLQSKMQSQVRKR